MYKTNSLEDYLHKRSAHMAFFHWVEQSALVSSFHMGRSNPANSLYHLREVFPASCPLCSASVYCCLFSSSSMASSSSVKFANMLPMSFKTSAGSDLNKFIDLLQLEHLLNVTKELRWRYKKLQFRRGLHDLNLRSHYTGCLTVSIH